MKKSDLLSWLSAVHLRREKEDLVLPDVPNLATLLEFSNEFWWSSFCQQEVLDLGDACGLHLSEYLYQEKLRSVVPGRTAGNPIVIDDDITETNSTDFHQFVSTESNSLSGDVGGTQDSSPGSHCTCNPGFWEQINLIGQRRVDREMRRNENYAT